MESISYSSKQTYIPINNNFKGLYINQVKNQGISFLCPEIDKRTGGMVPGTLSVLAGGPGSMKTTTAVNIAYEAVKQGKNVCIISLEETPFTLYCKLLSRVSVDLGKVLNTQEVVQHKLSNRDENILLDEVYPYFEELKGTCYFLGESDFSNIDVPSIERKLKYIDGLIKKKSQSKNNEVEHGIDLLIVDHIQMLKYSNPNQKDEYKVINSYVNFFRCQSLSFLHESRQIAVLLLSQLSRDGYNYAQKHDGMYLMQHIAEASEIERAASYIISVYTDSTCQLSKLLKFGTVKLRGAPTIMDSVNVFADGEHYHVGEIYNEDVDYDLETMVNVSNENASETEEKVKLTNEILSEFGL